MKPVYLEFEKPICELESKLADLATKQEAKPKKAVGDRIEKLERELSSLRKKIYGNISTWQRVQISRHPNRPFMLDYVARCFTDFIEIHGDRHIGDDHSMPCGFATLDGVRCVVIGHQKGRDTKENLLRNFGSAHPEGYRKALRAMRLAHKHGLPVVTLIDTPGAFPGVEAEERNIAESIAFNLREMMGVRTPIVSVIIGEGGSGGALGVGVADRVLILENAYYSVISPEGCAAILWKDRKHAAEAAEALQLAAGRLLELGVVDEVVPEPEGGAHRDHAAAAEALADAVGRHLAELATLSEEDLLDQRYAKFRSCGEFAEEEVPEPDPEAEEEEEE